MTPAHLWLLTCGRRGDLAQLREVARLSGWSTAEKQITLRVPAIDRPPWLTGLLLDAPSRAGLMPPWPRAIAFAEAAAAGAALAIRRASGGQSRVIAIGRPPGNPVAYDLILTSAQYALAEGPAVARLPVPLTGRVTADHDATAELARRMGTAPRPWTLLLVGGAVAPDCLDAAIAARLAAEVQAFQQAHGGSLMVITSPRTGADAAQALAATLPQAALFHRWQPEGFNPYAAALTMADRVIATSDSISMPVEALVVGKPVMIYRLPQRRGLALGLLAGLYGAGGPRFGAGFLFRSGLVESPADRLAFFAAARHQGGLDWFPHLPQPPVGDRLAAAQAIARARLQALSGEAQGNGSGENQYAG